MKSYLHVTIIVIILLAMTAQTVVGQSLSCEMMMNSSMVSVSTMQDHSSHHNNPHATEQETISPMSMDDECCCTDCSCPGSHCFSSPLLAIQIHINLPMTITEAVLDTETGDRNKNITIIYYPPQMT